MTLGKPITEPLIGEWGKGDTLVEAKPIIGKTLRSAFMPAQDGQRQRTTSHGTIIEAKVRQANRISELGTALAAAGYVTVDEQARALGLSRRTSWAVLKGNHKASALSAAMIGRMLSSPELPPGARTTLLTYVEEKAAGLYDHNK